MNKTLLIAATCLVTFCGSALAEGESIDPVFTLQGAQQPTKVDETISTLTLNSDESREGFTITAVLDVDVIKSITASNKPANPIPYFFSVANDGQTLGIAHSYTTKQGYTTQKGLTATIVAKDTYNNNYQRTLGMEKAFMGNTLGNGAAGLTRAAITLTVNNADTVNFYLTLTRNDMPEESEITFSATLTGVMSDITDALVINMYNDYTDELYYFDQVADAEQAWSLNKGIPNVPEPATATLGLLALAGLAARRRRK